MRALATAFAAAMFLLLGFTVPDAGAHSKTLTVGSSAVSWSTSQQYGDKDAPTIWLKYKGRDLRGTQVKAGCVFDFAGYGLSARVRSCVNGKGKRSPISLRVANARGDTVKVRFVWKVVD